MVSTTTGEDAGRETFGRSVQLRPSAHLKRSLIFKEMIVILSCHGYGGLSFVARRKRKIMPLENGSFFRVSRCNFNKSWISGRARGMRGWKREGRDSGGRNSLRIRYTASTSLPCINLSSRRYLHVRPSYFLPLSLSLLFFFRKRNDQRKKIHLIRITKIVDKVVIAYRSSRR